MIEGAILNNHPAPVHMYHKTKKIERRYVYGYEYYSDGGKFYMFLYSSRSSRDNAGKVGKESETGTGIRNKIPMHGNNR